MKKILIIVGVTLLALAIAGGSFYAGIAYNRNQANQIRSNFMRERGMNPSDLNQAPGVPAQGFFGGSLTGQIKSIDGNTLTLSTPRDVTTVTISEDTQVKKSTPASSTELQPGKSVLITGQRDANGHVTATEIMILDSTFVLPTPRATP